MNNKSYIVHFVLLKFKSLKGREKAISHRLSCRYIMFTTEPIKQNYLYSKLDEHKHVQNTFAVLFQLSGYLRPHTCK